MGFPAINEPHLVTMAPVSLADTPLPELVQTLSMTPTADAELAAYLESLCAPMASSRSSPH